VLELPAEAAIPELRRALREEGRAVLVAPPGAGKTTLVPLRLKDEPWLGGRRIVMLEPRRLAARLAAGWMAESLGEPVGGTVGYRIHREARVGPRTRIEVITEGILTRMLQSDPALEGIGLLIFDEFHERSLHSDLGLALSLQSRTLLRPDLALLVMSATLEAERVATLLGGAPVIRSEGRQFPVEVRHRPPSRGVAPEQAILPVIRVALVEQPGDVLVFLPGAGEIRRVEAALRSADLVGDPIIVPLFGMLAREDQDRAIRPDPGGRRKVVLATAIAETSLTIEGVRSVVDSGLMRVPRFSPRTGMQRLETVRVSRAAADQRCGRAGRLGPGVCYRLWSEAETAGLVPHTTPEIREADLAPLALELAAWGVRDPLELAWLDPPAEAPLAGARELLTELGALDSTGTITAHGRRMSRLGTHPRLAHLLLRGADEGHGFVASQIAALLGERDIVRRTSGLPPDPDLRLRLEALARGSFGGRGMNGSIDGAAARRIATEAEEWRRRLGIRQTDKDPDAAGLLLAYAYPDRIAQRRPNSPGRYLLRNGRGATLPSNSALLADEYLVVAEIDDSSAEGRIQLAAPISLEELLSHLGDQILDEREAAWNRETGSVTARRRSRIGAIVLREIQEPEPDGLRAIEILLGVVRAEGVAVLPWTPEARETQARIRFLHRLEQGWPDVSGEALRATPEKWLGAALHGLLPRPRLRDLDLADALLRQLDWRQRTALDRDAPTHLQVPSGSRIRVDYSDPDAPILAVRLQEMFGQRDTPRIAGGRVPLTVHLLSPAGRPVQVTQDLASFWGRGYFDVRKDLRGRYPKHSWPEDPLSAEAVRGVRRR
jgi:ATP-dependent helicase HrpB